MLKNNLVWNSAQTVGWRTDMFVFDRPRNPFVDQCKQQLQQFCAVWLWTVSKQWIMSQTIVYVSNAWPTYQPYQTWLPWSLRSYQKAMSGLILNVCVCVCVSPEDQLCTWIE